MSARVAQSLWGKGCCNWALRQCLTLLCAITRKPFGLGLVSQSPCDVTSQDPIPTTLVAPLPFVFPTKRRLDSQESAEGEVDDSVGRWLRRNTHDWKDGICTSWWLTFAKMG